MKGGNVSRYTISDYETIQYGDLMDGFRGKPTARITEPVKSDIRGSPRFEFYLHIASRE